MAPWISTFQEDFPSFAAHRQGCLQEATVKLVTSWNLHADASNFRQGHLVFVSYQVNKPNTTFVPSLTLPLFLSYRLREGRCECIKGISWAYHVLHKGSVPPWQYHRCVLSQSILWLLIRLLLLHRPMPLWSIWHVEPSDILWDSQVS